MNYVNTSDMNRYYNETKRGDSDMEGVQLRGGSLYIWLVLLTRSTCFRGTGHSSAVTGTRVAVITGWEGRTRREGHAVVYTGWRYRVQKWVQKI